MNSATPASVLPGSQGGHQPFNGCVLVNFANPRRKPEEWCWQQGRRILNRGVASPNSHLPVTASQSGRGQSRQSALQRAPSMQSRGAPPTAPSAPQPTQQGPRQAPPAPNSKPTKPNQGTRCWFATRGSTTDSRIESSSWPTD